MNHDSDKSGSGAADDFWGETPDWTDSPRRPRRDRSTRGADVSGAIKGLWSSAMSSGADGTREHRVIDASASADDTPVVGPTMFDDLDTEFPLSSSGRVDAIQPGEFGATDSRDVTTEVPIVASAAGPDDEFDDEKFAAMAPVALVERDDKRRGMVGGLDPLLVRIGAVAIATTLMVPLAIGWTSDDGDRDTIASAVDETFEATGDASSTSDEVSTTVVLDPADLPPAVPVQRSTESGETSSTSEDSTSEPESSSSSSEDSSSETDAGESGETSSTSSGSTAATTQAAAVDNCAIDYEVQYGDFWLRLADGAGVPLAELLEANDATIDTALFPESTICLPAGSSTPPPPEPPTTAAPTTAAQTTAAPTTAASTTAAPTTAAPTTEATTTTEAPSTTAAPAPPSNSNASAEQVKQIIRDVWPDELEDRAIEIAYRESRFVPTAKNYCCYGIFQMYWSVHRSWLADIGITSDQQLFDPTNNARAAYALYQRAGGWSPWSQTAY